MPEKRKPALCRYCGGKIRTVICDNEGNIHDEEYLKEPYSGVGYMLAHDRSDVPAGIECPICTQDDAIGSRIYDTEDEAYEAAYRVLPTLDGDITWPTEPFDSYDDQLKTMESLSYEERLQYIRDIVDDYDGYRSANGLAKLLNEVYAIAGSKPKNLPLTKDQIGKMPRLAAVWVYFSKKYDPMVTSAQDALIGFADDTMCKHPIGSLFFAAPPTESDIDAAFTAKGEIHEANA